VDHRNCLDRLSYNGALAWRNFTEAAADRARFDEGFADSQLAYHKPDAAKFTLRNAARNWRLALRFDEATRVEDRINVLRKHTGQGASVGMFDDIPITNPPGQATQAPQASSIPRARPVKKSMFDDLIPARTATPGR
jgi:hypothetical protein